MLFYRISVVLIIIPIVFSVRYNEFDRDKRKILPERVQVQTDYGRIEGWNVDLGWTKQKYKHVHLFFGIPYAKPPFTELRFKPPERPDNWHGILDATYFRPACPQHPSHMEPLLKRVNISEDCLHLNIYTPYKPDSLDKPDNNRYDVMVYIHGGKFRYGSGQTFPGNIFAEDNIVVVTFNYRLNALGFLSTNDERAPGNYGFLDMIAVLEFVRDQIQYFRGNRDSVTLVGHDAGAMAAGLLTVSPKARNLFHNVIAMDGSDLCESAVVQPMDGNIDYARDLAKNIGCPYDDTERMVHCLRYSRTAQEMAYASDEVTTKQWYQGWTGGPWAATVGGSSGFLPKHPRVMREEGDFKKLKYYMSGISKDGGSDRLTSLKNIGDGLDRYQFRDVLGTWMRRYRGVLDVRRTVDTLETEYTNWVHPNNASARRQMLIDLWTDYEFGSCVDGALKSYAQYSNNITMYVFNHRSNLSTTPAWRGVDHGSELQYVAGFPYLNDPIYNTTGLKLNQKYNELDKNISEFMIRAWGDFVKYQNSTQTPIKNVTWLPFLSTNLTYFMIENNSYVMKNYRQEHYGFWREYFPVIALRPEYTTTEYPTVYPPIELRISVWVLGALAIIFLIVVAALAITLCKKRKESELY
ncbi:neuroligin-4, X-linked-like [Lineus longissimus]|uniref:neuroligin-4, X-linked-like n=1 Tax=Lineus longissimus TaxID=88925 RepID=UPI002B4DCF97